MPISWTSALRGFNLKRIINNRFGIGRRDDDLPPRMRTLRKTGEGIDFDVPPINQLMSDNCITGAGISFQAISWTSGRGAST